MTGVILAEETDCASIGAFAGPSVRIECAVSDTAQGVLETLFNWLVGGATWAVEWTGTAWLSFPEPTIGTAEGVPSATVDQIWTLGSFYIMGIAVVSLLVGIIRLVWTPNRQTGMALLRGVAAIITVQTAGIAVTAILLDAGSQFSTWVVEEASGKDFTTALADFSGMGGVASTLSAAGAINSLSSAIAFAALGFLLLLVAAFAQVCLLIVRTVLIVVLWAFLPFLASSAFTDGGSKALSRAVGWLFALILYKPVAGIVYAIGILQMKNAGDDATVHEQMLNLLVAVVTVGFAALALPALIKFVAPQAAVGASMAFSGGAIAAGAVGTGAAVVAMGATGGASAAAGTGAAGTGAAPTGAAGAAKEGAGATKGGADGAGTTAPTGGPASGSAPKDGGQGAETTSNKSAPDSGGSSSSAADSVTGEGASTSSGDAPSFASPADGAQRSNGQGSPSDGSSTSGTEGSASDAAPASPDGARTTDTSAGESSSSTADKSAEKPEADGAEQTAPPSPAPQGASSAGGVQRSSQIAGAVRDVANGTRSGASDVDFNKGQEET